MGSSRGAADRGCVPVPRPGAKLKRRPGSTNLSIAAVSLSSRRPGSALSVIVDDNDLRDGIVLPL